MEKEKYIKFKQRKCKVKIKASSDLSKHVNEFANQ